MDKDTSRRPRGATRIFNADGLHRSVGKGPNRHERRRNRATQGARWKGRSARGAFGKSWANRQREDFGSISREKKRQKIKRRV
mgnify:CR=1 FL=1